jgi:hypothetical protein
LRFPKPGPAPQSRQRCGREKVDHGLSRPDERIFARDIALCDAALRRKINCSRLIAFRYFQS